MIAQAIQKLLDIANPEIIPALGRTYSSKPIHPVYEPQPEIIRLSSLAGLVDYYNGEGESVLEEASDTPDTLAAIGPGFFHVENFNTVSILSNLHGSWKQRTCFATAKADLFEPFTFNRFLSHEEFMIGLQTRFIQTDTTRQLLQLLGNIKDSAVKTTVDDGVSQKVQTNHGISLVEEIRLPNPVALKPFRTFIEIDQPESLFVLRLQGSAQGKMPSCALYEADGGAWKVEAMAGIKGYLEGALPDGVVVVA